jgi:sugar (pentulose or hexulose) kinase
MSGILGVDIGHGSIKLVIIDKDTSGVLFLENIGENKLILESDLSGDTMILST